MTPPSPRQSPSPRWGFLVAEAVLIVSSILMALAIESWWAERQQEAARVDLLYALQEDFAVTSRGLDAALDSAQSHVARTGGYLRAVADGAPLSRDSLLHLVEGVGAVTFFEPSMTAYNAASATGGLELVRNPDLLRAFTAFDLALRNYDDHVGISFNLFFGGPTHDLRRAMGGFQIPAGGAGADLFQVETVVPPGFDLRSDVVAASVESVYWVQVKVLQSLRDMSTAVERILRELAGMLE